MEHIATSKHIIVMEYHLLQMYSKMLNVFNTGTLSSINVKDIKILAQAVYAKQQHIPLCDMIQTSLCSFHFNNMGYETIMKITWEILDIIPKIDELSNTANAQLFKHNELHDQFTAKMIQIRDC
jgi:hypothetical protein